MAVLIFAGLRIGEACALERRDIDLPNGRIDVRDSKTAAGIREVTILPVLRDELGAHLAAFDLEPFDPVFPSARGQARNPDNARQRVIEPVIERANEIALERSGRPLMEGVTAHKLRHTFSSLLLVHNSDPANAMAQLGHTDPGFTLRVYTHLMRRSDEERAKLRALIEGRELALIGTTGASGPGVISANNSADPRDTASASGN